jgi:hypothetical protein
MSLPVAGAPDLEELEHILSKALSTNASFLLTEALTRLIAITPNTIRKEAAIAIMAEILRNL